MYSKEEFNQYLESIGGLVNGFYPDRDLIKDCDFCDVNIGWYGLIKDLISELIAAGWDKQICQIKEKFGGLRFYPNSMNEECWNLITKYEELSEKTCEKCGKSDDSVLLRNESWLVTLCDECYE